MTALELAEWIERDGTGCPNVDAASMLRRQHEAIQKLREALYDIAAFYSNSWAADRANRALKDTEDLA